MKHSPGVLKLLATADQADNAECILNLIELNKRKQIKIFEDDAKVVSAMIPISLEQIKDGCDSIAEAHDELYYDAVKSCKSTMRDYEERGE